MRKAPQVVILAGGLATRLRPLTQRVPKALVPIGGRPFLDYQLEWLRRQGVTEVDLLVGHLGEQIVDHVATGVQRGLHVRFHYDGGQLLGTGGALRNALGLLGSSFVVVNGDTFIDLDLHGFWQALTRGGFRAGLVVGPPTALAGRPNVFARGQSLELYDAAGSDPHCSLAHFGVCGFRADVIAELPLAKPADLSDLVDLALSSGTVLAWRTDAPAFDIGTPAGIARFEGYVREEQTSSRRKGRLVR